MRLLHDALRLAPYAYQDFLYFAFSWLARTITGKFAFKARKFSELFSASEAPRGLPHSIHLGLDNRGSGAGTNGSSESGHLAADRQRKVRVAHTVGLPSWLTLNPNKPERKKAR